MPSSYQTIKSINQTWLGGEFVDFGNHALHDVRTEPLRTSAPSQCELDGDTLVGLPCAQPACQSAVSLSTVTHQVDDERSIE